MSNLPSQIRGCARSLGGELAERGVISTWVGYYRTLTTCIAVTWVPKTDIGPTDLGAAFYIFLAALTAFSSSQTSSASALPYS